jgi:hypothetical protein
VVIAGHGGVDAGADGFELVKYLLRIHGT